MGKLNIVTMYDHTHLQEYLELSSTYMADNSYKEIYMNTVIQHFHCLSCSNMILEKQISKHNIWTYWTKLYIVTHRILWRCKKRVIDTLMQEGLRSKLLGEWMCLGSQIKYMYVTVKPAVLCLKLCSTAPNFRFV